MLFKTSSLCRNAIRIQAIRNLHVSNKLANENSGGGFFERVFGTKVEKATQAHSVLLADQQVLYELQIHNVKPEAAKDYENVCNELMPKLEKNNPNMKLTGSWRSEIGALDNYVHLWQYKNYAEFSIVNEQLKKDQDLQAFNQKICKLINRRENQVCLSFTFWGLPTPRSTNHIYEMRSYALKPGTLIEWGNNWSRGIRNRMDYRVAGMFTQVGPLYYVHHIWAYKSLADRKSSREQMWNKPGWDECVAYTVPLIRKMESKIMSPLAISPMK